MAALTLAAGICPTSSLADDPPAPKSSTPAPSTPDVKPQSVRLDVWIRGLTKDGCDVEIKPGGAGCKFQPQTHHVGIDGKLNVEMKDVEVRSADRDCTFAITIREPGQPVRTMFRGLRISATPEKGSSPLLTCYLSSPSRLARANEAPATKR
jgi:hypothetical protein